jgi:hypothetical protein
MMDFVKMVANCMEVAGDSVRFRINGVESSDFVTKGLALFRKTIKISHNFGFIWRHLVPPHRHFTSEIM